jgi:hypothetical protein
MKDIYVKGENTYADRNFSNGRTHPLYHSHIASAAVINSENPCRNDLEIIGLNS